MIEVLMFRRIHEWLADHLPGVQYPEQRVEFIPADHVPIAKKQGIRFKYQMPWEKRLLIFTLSIVTLLITIPLLAFMGLVAWAFLTSL
jgi:hypothetical protein